MPANWLLLCLVFALALLGTPASETARAIMPGRPPAEDRVQAREPLRFAAPAVSGSTAPVLFGLFYDVPSQWNNPPGERPNRIDMLITSKRKGDEAYASARRSTLRGPSLLYLMANETSGPPFLVRKSDNAWFVAPPMTKSEMQTSCSYAKAGQSYDPNQTGFKYYPDLTGVGDAEHLCTQFQTKPDAFISDGAGNLVFDVETMGDTTTDYILVPIYQMNPGSAAWRDYVARRVSQVLVAGTHDGVFLDNLDQQPGRKPSTNAAYGKAYLDQRVGTTYGTSDSEVNRYRTDVSLHLAGIRQGLPTGNKLWANLTLVWVDDRKVEWAQNPSYLGHLDGTMEEGFVADFHNGADWVYLNPDGWKETLARAQGVLNRTNNQGQSIAYLAVGQGPAQLTDRMRVALASYLLIAESAGSRKTYFRYASAIGEPNGPDPYRGAWTYPEYDYDLGDPIGPRVENPPNVMTRQFRRPGAPANEVSEVKVDYTSQGRPWATITVAQAPSCSPRNPVGLRVAPRGDDLLEVTVQPGEGALSLQQVAFTSMVNSWAEYVDPSGLTQRFTDPRTHTLPAGTGEFLFKIIRQSANNAATVFFTPRDGCGDQQKFAGGGSPPWGNRAILGASGTATATVGQTLTYQLSVSSGGEFGADDVVVTNALPDGASVTSATASQGGCEVKHPVRCFLGTLASGASATITVQAVATGPGTFANTASVSSSSHDPDLADNAMTLTTTIVAPNPQPSSRPNPTPNSTPPNPAPASRPGPTPGSTAPNPAPAGRP